MKLRLKWSLRLSRSMGLRLNLWLSLSLNLRLRLRGNLLRKADEGQRTDQSHSRDAHTEKDLVSAKPLDVLHKGRVVKANITALMTRVKHSWSKRLNFCDAKTRARRGKRAAWHAPTLEGARSSSAWPGAFVDVYMVGKFRGARAPVPSIPSHDYFRTPGISPIFTRVARPASSVKSTFSPLVLKKEVALAGNNSYFG